MSLASRVRLFAAAAIVMVQLLSGSVFPTSRVAEAQDAVSAQVVPNRFIVTLKPTAGLSASSVASSYGRKPGVSVRHVYASAFNGFAGEFNASALAALRNDPNVAAITPDYVMKAMGGPVPTGINRADADLNPTKSGDGTGSVSVDVAVLDTGVDMHPDLNVVGGADCVYGTDPYSDQIGHGTHVAGTIGAYDDGDSVVGVAPGARIYSVKVLPDFGDGSFADVICGVDWVAARWSTIEVANMSLGGDIQAASNSCAADPLHQAICTLVSRGVTVVVASGNFAMDSATTVPAQYDEVITVSAYADLDGDVGGLAGCPFVPSTGAFECDDSMATFSNYGRDVDISAPGVDILSTVPGGTAVYSGTSMASPHVAGGAALIYAQQGRMSPASIKARLLLVAQPGPIDYDPDSYKEPVLNVAFLGKGKIVAPSSAKVGDTIQVRVGDYTPDTRAIFRFNGTYIGGDTIDDAGRGHRNYKIPNMPAGSYKATVTNGLKAVNRTVKIVSSVSVSPGTGVVGETITVTLRGFAKNEVVDVRLGSKLVINDKAVSSSGYGKATFVVPAMPGGSYALTATGTLGNTANSNFTVAPSAYLSIGTPEPGSTVTISYRGFKVGEVIEMRFDSQAGPLGNSPTETASRTGSGSDGVLIPADSPAAERDLWVVGDMGTIVHIQLTIGAASEPDPTVTATPEASPTVIVETPTEAPTEMPTESPTEVPTATPVAETPTDVPTVEASPVG